ncbi:3-hydroxyacyl-CoA dehydrogenase NAD-binding domain-containing protein [Vannielia litorea]|uniref:3-hydroxyacyl-CoA dehydrogenase NAD-binding domain-containing protein n=1 Tax=Vannielia litorea TaxID=1217970 RepID=UPI001C9865EB|nr:3-hydroxyacyl-CoA dehydrogenase NAD-binding domain-containing protein [Vannielia litorea]MBY6047815.1 enoyl-CoA hydratase/isomerase family protein [Vannielia litorea]MBY6075229.1 enoyl-CoA hydratase/isomerase family protein [Vannielia litorea]
MQINDVISIEREGPLALIVIDNPPVNAAGHAVREGLWKAVEAVEADDGVEAVAIYGKGRAFIAGADIREFGKPRMEPILTDVCNRIEACPKPVVAVLHGSCFGGGLEVAIGCHARVAIPGVKVGFPEVTLGVIPGAGGTQRGPRLMGIGAALSIITTGERIGHEDALSCGLVDRVAEGEPRDVALAMAEEARVGTLPCRKTGEIEVTPDAEAVEATKAKLATKAAHLFAPHRAVEAVEACTGPLEAGLALEREKFQACIESPQRAGLIHAFFAERAVEKIPEAGADPREVSVVGVIGGGTMGSGIATACLNAGLTVRMNERDEEALGRGRDTVGKNLAGAVKRGKMSEAKRDAALERFKPSTALEDFADCDVVIEAVFEDMGVKRDVFGRLDAICKPGAVLASNTSYLDVNEIAACTSRPEDVIGLHFFSPAHIMRLLEVVVAAKTAPEVVATGFALAKKLRKVGVRAGVCDGFIGNRILSHYKKVADYLVLDGAAPHEVDAAIEDFGFAMGPFAVSDLAGLDIGWANRKRLAPTRPAEERYVAVADRICEAGNFGRKTGRGFYVYGEGQPEPAPEVAEIVAEEREKAGVTAREFSKEAIQARFITAMIAEATRVLEDGIALRPIDIDAVFLFGYGFPRHRGGPMHTADVIGAGELVARIERYAKEDPYYWQVPDLLRKMAAEGTTFAEMN